MPDSVDGPWEQAEGSDYDEPGSGGDSHEDEFDEEYGEQEPKGDPDRPDDAWWEHQYGGAVDAYEDLARLNKFARPFDHDGPLASDAAALNPFARPFDHNASSASDAAAYNPFADSLEDSSTVSLSSQLTSPDPDDFDRAESIDYIGPPIPDNAAGEPDTASSQSVNPASQFTDSVGDSSVSLPSVLTPPDQLEPEGTYEVDTVDTATSSPSFDPAAQFGSDIAEWTESTEFME
jgi:hypothetical protein